jgi:choline dehydrogenase
VTTIRRVDGRVAAHQNHVAETQEPTSTKTSEETKALSVAEQKAVEKVVAAPPRAQERYDYVFIGAGATGATAAADLSDLLAQADALKRQGFSVLVLEGGKDQQTQTSEVPAEHALASEDKKLLADPNRTGEGTGYWVKQFSDRAAAMADPKANANGEVFKPRGEGFGGSTRMNANVFVRIDDKDWDALALATGDPAFLAKNMKPLLQELTKVEYRPVLKFLNAVGKTFGFDALRNMNGLGFDGPLAISRADPRLLGSDAQLATVALKGLWWSLTRLGTPLEKLKRIASLFDPNNDLTQGTEGAVVMPTSINMQGKRNGARDLILAAKTKHPDTLTLRDGARVKQLLLNDNKRCTGVVYTDAKGLDHRILIEREAIVAAGAFETPALLMRSGIGPKDELSKLGIAAKVPLEGVGKKQGFRYEVGLVVRLKRPLALVQNVPLPPKPGDPALEQWLAGKGGPLASNGAILSFQSKSRPDLPEPDLFVFAVPGKFRGYVPGYSKEATEDPHLMTFVILNKNKGESGGTTQLDPNNPTGAPLVNHHFHDERRAGDTAPIVAGIKQVRDLIATQFADMIEGEVWPGPLAQSDEALSSAVKAESWDHHPRGGAQMGHASDANAVVDSDFRVLGTTGLRVIDASILPNNIGDFIVSGLYQVGKLAARKIAADAETGPRPAQRFNPLSIRLAPKAQSLEAAQQVTAETADASKAAGQISAGDFAALIDGTVSQVDMDIAWAAIDNVLARGEEKGGDKHTIAHNLLIAVAQQVELQSPMTTKLESIKDRVTKFFGGRT